MCGNVANSGETLFTVWRLGGPLMARTDPREIGHLEGTQMARLK